MFLDILLLIVLVWGFVTGYRRGILHSLFFLVGIAAGILTAVKFSALAGTYISEWLAIDPTYLPIISFALVFILTLGIVLMIANGLEELLKFAKLNLFNKLAGAVVWMTIGLLVLSTAFWYLAQYELLGQEQINESKTYDLVAPVSPFVVEQVGKVIPVLQDVYQDIEDMVRPDPDPLDNIIVIPAAL